MVHTNLVLTTISSDSHRGFEIEASHQGFEMDNEQAHRRTLSPSKQKHVLWQNEQIRETLCEHPWPWHASPRTNLRNLLLLSDLDRVSVIKKMCGMMLHVYTLHVFISLTCTYTHTSQSNMEEVTANRIHEFRQKYENGVFSAIPIDIRTRTCMHADIDTGTHIQAYT